MENQRADESLEEEDSKFRETMNTFRKRGQRVHQFLQSIGTGYHTLMVPMARWPSIYNANSVQELEAFIRGAQSTLSDEAIQNAPTLPLSASIERLMEMDLPDPAPQTWPVAVDELSDSPADLEEAAAIITELREAAIPQVSSSNVPSPLPQPGSLALIVRPVPFDFRDFLNQAAFEGVGPTTQEFSRESQATSEVERSAIPLAIQVF